MFYATLTKAQAKNILITYVLLANAFANYITLAKCENWAALICLPRTFFNCARKDPFKIFT